MISAKVSTDILRNLRKLMSEKCIDAYIVPMDDEHNNEYLASCDKKIQFLSGFSGSYGNTVITDNKAVLWTDSRYTEQASKQIDENWTLFNIKLKTVANWLSDELKSSNKTVGFYRNQMPITMYNDLRSKLSSDYQLVKLDECLVSKIWLDKPMRPSNPLLILNESITGKSWICKIECLREKMKENKVECLFIHALDEIAWLFNLRGSDIEYNPVFFSYCVVSLNKIHLIIDKSKLDSNQDICDHFAKGISCDNDAFRVKIHQYDDNVNELLENIFKDYQKIWFDSQVNYGFLSLVSTDKAFVEPSPIILMKAVKTPEELHGMTEASIHDSVALCRFFYWLENQMHTDNKITESDAADELDKYRSELDNFASLSFSTISCVGKNGGMIHYEPERGHDAIIDISQVYLCDSGGQYTNGGTTDVTRTVHFGNPSPQEKLAYTLVLKSHINLAKCIFPYNTPGGNLDVLARNPFWQYGTDYGHGTGHGVGSFLNVHERPCSFSGSRSSGQDGLINNMVITIEPGLYSPGKFGIRIESDYVIESAEFTDTRFTEISPHKQYLRFRPITYFPIQTKMIDVSLLTDVELQWLNQYHELCREKIGDVLRHRGLINESRWFLEETEPLHRRTTQ